MHKNKIYFLFRIPNYQYSAIKPKSRFLTISSNMNETQDKTNVKHIHNVPKIILPDYIFGYTLAMLLEFIHNLN